MISRALPMILAVSALAVIVTIYGGIRHDYFDYLQQWQLVRDGADPWGSNNAYGPLHNLFAFLVPIRDLAPKLVTAASLLLVNGMLLITLLATRPVTEWRATYLIAFGANLLVLVTAFWFGLNDAFVAALVLGAVLARRDGAMILAGVLLGLATLDKYYPALLIPFFAIDARVLQPRLLLAALGTIALGLIAATIVWGSAWFEAVAFGVSRDATILSIFRPIAVLGRQLGIADITDQLVRFNGPLVLLVWIGSIVAVWLRRDNWLIGACWGFFAVLLTYKVGHQQFWTTWLALVAALPLLNATDADRLAKLSWPYALFLSLFSLGFVVLQPQYYQGQWRWVNDVAGVPSFVLGVALLWLYLRPAPRPAP
ncbi:MAG: glycosyltransferase family 87 protein [Devosia sp.]